MGFPKQEYWSGLLFPSPGDLPDPGIEPASSGLAGRFFLLSHQRSPLVTIALYYNGDQSAKTGVTDMEPFFSTSCYLGRLLWQWLYLFYSCSFCLATLTHGLW